MTSAITITLAQTTVSPHPEVNLQTAHKCIQQAAAQGSDLIVFPEMFMACPQEGVSLATVAEPINGPFVDKLASLAVEHGIAVICGMWEAAPGEEDRAANVAIALGSDGKLLASYNKIHLFDALSVRESDLMLGGHIPPPLFTLKGIQLGLAICYDLRFPELFRDLVLRGADAVIVPSAWYAGSMKEEQWLTLLQARAIENTIYVAGANLCGVPFAARSAVFDPFGVMIAGSGECEALITARFERARIKEVRTKLPSLTHVRRDLFRS